MVADKPSKRKELRGDQDPFLKRKTFISTDFIQYKRKCGMITNRIVNSHFIPK